jgi:ABC-type spermidine/putrescine transport system permease subunit II
MNSTVLAAISISVALFLGFTVSFVVSPDPTGILPVVVGVILTGVLIPLLYLGIQQLFAPNESST